MQLIAVVCLGLAVALAGKVETRATAYESKVLESLLKRVIADMLIERVNEREIDVDSIQDVDGPNLKDCMPGTTSSRGRKFRILDDDSSDRISQEEFLEGLADYKCNFGDRQKQVDFFNSLDEDEDREINFNEFSAGFKEPLSASDKEILIQAFNKADKNQDGIFDAGDRFSTTLIDQADDKKNPDGKVTLDEFVNYYRSMAENMSDEYFKLMLMQAWKI